MNQEFEIRHLDLGRAALAAADWTGVDKELQAFYADYPSKPLLLVK